jgi:hypothetical protein
MLVVILFLGFLVKLVVEHFIILKRLAFLVERQRKIKTTCLVIGIMNILIINCDLLITKEEISIRPNQIQYYTQYFIRQKLTFKFFPLKIDSNPIFKYLG